RPGLPVVRDCFGLSCCGYCLLLHRSGNGSVSFRCKESRAGPTGGKFHCLVKNSLASPVYFNRYYMLYLIPWTGRSFAGLYDDGNELISYWIKWSDYRGVNCRTRRYDRLVTSRCGNGLYDGYLLKAC